MSLQIYIAHTGERLLADPVSFASPDALRSWIARSTSISPQRQILMTARGKNVKIQTLATENEIFVYDRQYVSEPGKIQVPEIPSPQPLQLSPAPDTLADQNNLQAWRNLYMARRTWALDVAERCVPINDAIQEHTERADNIYRAVGVALENLKAHVGSLEHRFQEAQAWANDLLKEQMSVLEGWQGALSKLENIPARKDFTFLGRPSTPKKDRDRSNGTLQDFVDVEEVRQAGPHASAASQQFAHRIQDIEKAVGDIASDTQTLLVEARPEHGDTVEGLLEEVEALAKKISSDYEHVLGLPSNTKTLANVSRMALSHTKNILPSLREIVFEFQAALDQAVKRRNAATKVAINHMRTISSIESRLAEVQAQIVNLDVEGDAFEPLYSVFHMPFVYGSVLIEAVRRREWGEKMKTDSLTLAEEMAVFRDEEQRRRRKWLKTMGDFLSLSDDSTPGIEINLQGHELQWPDVARKEVELYIDELKANGMSGIVEQLSQMYRDIDAPTRQQKRRAKAFKHGSVFDMGRSSLLIRGDDMVRSLKDEKTKLEDKLKGSESRIRKLEDLLHRQSQISRPVSGNFGADIPTSPASPRPDPFSRRSSVSSRRMSSNQPPEEKALVQRIVALEAELVAERDTVQRLQKEAHAERQSSTDKMQEAQSTKKDLIGNLEARQREFQDERRFLESEVKKFKLRAEEAEEELDRAMDSREHEKQESDERIQTLEAEIEAVRAQTAEELQSISEQMEQIKHDYESQKEKSDALDAQVLAEKEEAERLRARTGELEKQVEELERRERESISSLQAAHMQLSPEGSAPDDFSRLVKAIEVLSEGLAIHARTTEEKNANAIAEVESLKERLAQLENETQELKKLSDMRESELSQLKDELSSERSRLSAAKAELVEEQSQLQHLRSKFAAGETGSEVLRERVAEEEKKAASLSERLSQVECKSRAAEEELLTWRKKGESLIESEKRAVSRLNARGERARQISGQLYAQVEKVGRMLEHLGFTVVRQDGNITVQRSSKVNSLSGIGEGLATSGIASVRPDAQLVTWVQSEDPDEEAARFASFMESLTKFDIDIFGDAVVKRVKDIETLARKWQKEARGYRDKYHRAQSEAHDKIAYRSFKEGDLALFLPTRNQTIRSWAAFNVGAPHYFLREQDVHKLSSRDWLLARISKVEERVVDLSKSMNNFNPDRRSIAEASDGASLDDENPFELSDGLRWYLLDAQEEKPGAPSTPGLGKSTVASAHVDAKGSIRLKASGGNVAKTLTKSLDSRRNSSASKKGTPTASTPAGEPAGDSSEQAAAADVGTQRREGDPRSDEGSEWGIERGGPEQGRISPSSSSKRASMTGSPSPTPASNKRHSIARSRPWEKLWSLDYRVEGGRQ
ncbi:hypothetical protein DTO166G4_4657 [Paecilomyces variotii]|uniref:Autophagy-related protein 11 n=1 Tax=Byssochlamys spectabilis TaxID=264951 RepID=A0A443HXD7_BYSSP|nr:putative Taz1-interacting factor 1 [Paecilomyces variotii]KAJ9213726.1 hypothetical protein DTO166G4_4657 [Paecilomyces variotii]KAJ9238166.1 hypothetical protein DTO166G5_3068 [Paecilomyces variotii]KAJ9309693.1 hypothetical protein DTO217A2_644 [Paecilomyces variotii]KAJ9356945.1 hypothetical protein DTO280E4_5828 [Paecilomyces variotii]RWQ96498.1 putative Taz1-interacting factor 1 [Paecilomyces variotii]